METSFFSRQASKMNQSHLNSTSEDHSPSVICSKNTSITRVVFPCLYALLFFTAAIFNSLAAWIAFHLPSSKTFVVYLKNMVVADLLTTVTILIKVISDSKLGSWQLQAFTCRFSAVVFYFTMYMSIILLGLISLDRFVKIVESFAKNLIQNPTFAKVLTVIIWIVLFSTTALPNMILTDKAPTPSSEKDCMLLKGSLGVYWHGAVIYITKIIFWTVFALMVTFYTLISKKVHESYRNSKSNDKNPKRKTKAKVFIIVGVFFFCFAPYHFVRIPYTLTQIEKGSNCEKHFVLYILKESTLWLSASNICLNPVIFIFLCKSFRQMLLKTLRFKESAC
ncbi:P2Y purinoceptor 13-like [Acipenser oxyrinchus oxyrinchus]|uniref:P2Y purinoceptor 13-like n=1 Tax=Acipenser oxyrinchus oxyrinchus TaxID=40147 RepID=A0AAD8DFV9_ACIOX|nr:P2Y purinoceptor 13-like [Acipenser oxyrinchus oxyrinchus]